MEMVEVKRRINSRKKGNRSEAEVCKLLSEYFPGKFERRTMGIAGADVICSDDKFPYATEVKHQKTVKAIHLFIGFWRLREWWEQARNQAGRVNKLPLLVAKVDRYWFSTTDGDRWELFEHWCSDELNRINNR